MMFCEAFVSREEAEELLASLHGGVAIGHRLMAGSWLSGVLLPQAERRLRQDRYGSAQAWSCAPAVGGRL